MRPGRLSFVKDPSVGDWIAPRLGPFGGQVGSVVPRGFPAYARVLHPVRDHDGEPATLSTVCAKTGRVAHTLMQWTSISSPPRTTWDRAFGWPGAVSTTEVDFDSTLIAGDNALIEAVLVAGDLEVTPIEPGDCIDLSGDTVNV